MYLSTRDKNLRVESLEAIKQGLSKDGGLFLFEELKPIKDIYEFKDFNYLELAKKIIGHVFEDINYDELSECIDKAYKHNFRSEEIVPLKKVGNLYFLELFHGPTCAFKDLALTLLPHIMKLTVKDKPVVILTATSGDTGKAALEGFKDVKGTYIKVLYPHNMVSKVQERQMTSTTGNNTEVLAVNGNFDDCQKMVKRIMESFKSDDVYLSSANSINIARLVPQIVYYFKAYFDLLKNKEIIKDEKIDFIVPTGNFGDILAGYMAKCLGLPVNKLVIASNENDVLTRFFKTGFYDSNRPLLNTISPSIDILVSSNLERLLFMKSKEKDDIKQYLDDLNKKGSFEISDDLLKAINEDFLAISSNQEEARKAIKEVYEENHYLMDTHTAVAYSASKKYHDEHKNVILATASPFKFSKAVYESLTGIEIEDNLEAMKILSDYVNKEIPEPLSKLPDLEIRHEEVINKDDDALLINKIKECR